MSVEGDSLAFHENVDADHGVDPETVDWQAIRDEYAASDGLLDVSSRTDALTQTVDGIENSRQASGLLVSAVECGLIEERDGDYYVPGDDGTIDADAVDWEQVFESVAGSVDQALPSAGKRNLAIEVELGLESTEQADELVTQALKRGLIVQTEGGLYLSDALEQPPQTPSPAEKSTSPTETTESEPEPSTQPDPTEEPTESERPDPERMARDDLEQEVRDLRTGMDQMETRMDALFGRMETMTQAVFGNDSVPGDPEKSEDLLTKFVELRDRVDEHDEKLTMVKSNGGGRSKPDERAMSLRTTLYEEAKASGEKKAVMDRDQAGFALSGGLSRAQILDAMRRAANGDGADINGSSDLEPIDGLEFVKGTGRDQQSKIRLDLSDTTGSDLRNNITTKDTADGGD